MPVGRLADENVKVQSSSVHFTISEHVRLTCTESLAVEEADNKNRRVFLLLCCCFLISEQWTLFGKKYF